MEEFILSYLSTYGYAMLFIAGVLGIVGIPVPEESLYVYIGMLAKSGSMSFSGALFSLVAGTCAGMAISYVLGRKIGEPLLERYGKYLGVTKKRFRKTVMRWDLSRSLPFGFFVPGIRQFNPYFAGMAKFSIVAFAVLSVLGSFIWVLVYMTAGYVISSYIHIEPEYLAAAGGFFFVLYVIHFLYKWKKTSHSRP